MNITSRLGACLIFPVLTACSAFQAAPEQAECAPVAPPPECPVCPACPAAEIEEALQCPEPQVVEKIVAVPAPPPAKTAGEKQLPIIGAVEWATIEPGNIRLEARIDTGEANSILQIEDLQLLEKDGKRWVQFLLLDPATGEKVAMEQRLRRTIVKKSGDVEKSRRYVVRMWVTLGESRTLADLTLSERGNMDHPLVIGRNVLVDNMIVDVSR